MRRLPFLLLAFLFSIPSFSQSKHPFTFEDMMKLKRVGAPQPSPDGKWVLFSVVDVDLDANSRTPHIWIVPITGGQEREIIKDQQADAPRWAPDGKRFVFTSTKSGNSQLWIADFDSATGTVTGNPHQLTFIETEASGPIWSPDGTNIAFTSDVYPECDGPPAQEQECNAKKVKEAAESKVKALIFDRLLYRHWNAYKEGKRTHIFVVPIDARVGADASSAQSSEARQGFSSASPSRAGEGTRPYVAIARDLSPGDYDSPVFSLGGQDNYAFSPDGQELCYTSNHDKVEAASTNNDLWIVAVSGGSAKNITADNSASDSTPLYSPDGKYIAYRAQQRPGYESDRFRLMLYDRKTGEKKNLTEGFDRWVGTFTWTADSTELLFVAENHGEQPIFVFDLDPSRFSPKDYSPCDLCSDRIHMVVSGPGYYDDIAVTSDKSVLVTYMSAMAPNFIFRVGPGMACVDSSSKQSSKQQVPKEPDSGCQAVRFSWPRRIESINRGIFAQTERKPLESFWFTGALGDKVQGFLVKPPNFDPNKKYPGEIPHSRRAAGGLGRRLVLSMESATFRGQWLCGCHDQLPRLDRLRAEVHRRDQRRLGWCAFRRPDEGPRLRRAALSVHRQGPRVRAGRQLRRLHGQLDSRPHQPLQVPGLARWHVQHRFSLGYNGRAVVQ
jgi:dipeptidyl aminopeptidase/acylaminoacyl peptidase